MAVEGKQSLHRDVGCEDAEAKGCSSSQIWCLCAFKKDWPLLHNRSSSLRNFLLVWQSHSALLTVYPCPLSLLSAGPPCYHQAGKMSICSSVTSMQHSSDVAVCEPFFQAVECSFVEARRILFGYSTGLIPRRDSIY